MRRVEHQRTSEMIDVLMPMWERVLQRASIRVSDDFFELGGDPALAVQLFAEIAEKCGRELPAEMIYRARTIASMAALLEQPGPPRFPPVVLLKAGTAQPPVFIAHGMGGSILEFFPLMKLLRSPRSIYGLQARGTDGVDQPLERIEDMAQFHLEAIKAVQPRGPYLLVGYSLGGLVTLEMAQRLAESGEEIALLAMLESYPDRRFLRLGAWIRLMIRLIGKHASTMMQLPMREAFSYMMDPSKRQTHISEHGGERAQQRSNVGALFAPVAERVRDAAYLALTRYRPRFYGGKVRFVKAEIPTEFPDDPEAVWAHLTDEFEMETVPGDHKGILTTHADRLAEILSRYLRESISQ
jgi:acetoacetyl-CoA synthetase